MFKRFLVICAVSLLAACSKPTDTVIPSDMSTWDKELAPSLKKLTEEDRAKVTAYLMRAKLGEAVGGNGIPIGTTLGDALEAQKKFEAEQAAKRAEEEALKKKLQEERATALAALNKAVTVTLLEKRELPRNWDLGRASDTQAFKIGVQNTSEKTVIGVAGRIKFVDVFGKEVGAVGFGISETIEPGKTHIWNGSRDYNRFIDEHRAVWNLEEGKYTTAFEPREIVYQDGTKLSVPE